MAMPGEETIKINQQQLEQALLTWEKQGRAGLLRSHAETDALPAEQVAQESARHLWALLKLG